MLSKNSHDSLEIEKGNTNNDTNLKFEAQQVFLRTVLWKP